jgi:hypothetical protein
MASAHATHASIMTLRPERGLSLDALGSSGVDSLMPFVADSRGSCNRTYQDKNISKTPRQLFGLPE